MRVAPSDLHVDGPAPDPHVRARSARRDPRGSRAIGRAARSRDHDRLSAGGPLPGDAARDRRRGGDRRNEAVPGLAEHRGTEPDTIDVAVTLPDRAHRLSPGGTRSDHSRRHRDHGSEQTERPERGHPHDVTTLGGSRRRLPAAAFAPLRTAFRPDCTDHRQDPALGVTHGSGGSSVGAARAAHCAAPSSCGSRSPGRSRGRSGCRSAAIRSAAAAAQA